MLSEELPFAGNVTTATIGPYSQEEQRRQR